MGPPLYTPIKRDACDQAKGSRSRPEQASKNIKSGLPWPSRAKASFCMHALKGIHGADLANSGTRLVQILQCLTGRLKPTMPLDWALEIRLGVFVKS